MVLFVFFFDSPPPPIQSCYVVVVAADTPNLLALNALACSGRELATKKKIKKAVIRKKWKLKAKS